MGDMARNLSRHEFACNCGCRFDTVDIDLAPVIQDSADYFAAEIGAPIRVDITGPNRCVTHNADEGGADDSQHIYGRAADYKLFIRHSGAQIDPELVADYLEKKCPDRFGIGRYSNRTHVDTRSNGPARWRG